MEFVYKGRIGQRCILWLKEFIMDPTFPLVPIVNFVAVVLVFSSMSKSMFQVWNVGACAFAIWVTIQSFTAAIGAILWSNNVKNSVPIWCDICERCSHPRLKQSNSVFVKATHLDVGSTVAIPGASFLNIRRLSIMISQGNVSARRVSIFLNNHKIDSQRKVEIGSIIRPFHLRRVSDDSDVTL